MFLPGLANNHCGNNIFRDYAEQLRPRYEKLSKEEKTGVSLELVSMVHEAGGRFIQKDEESGLWYEVGYNRARKKASQALREENPSNRADGKYLERYRAGKAKVTKHASAKRTLKKGVRTKAATVKLKKIATKTKKKTKHGR